MAGASTPKKDGDQKLDDSESSTASEASFEIDTIYSEGVTDDNQRSSQQDATKFPQPPSEDRKEGE